MTELCYGPYQTSWYLVKKSTLKKYRLVNVAVKLNQAIIRDVNLPLSANEFFEEFMCCVIAFLINFFLGYKQVKQDKKSRDLMAFMKALGFRQMRTLLQGVTNFIANFVWIIFKILAPIYKTKPSLSWMMWELKNSKPSITIRKLLRASDNMFWNTYKTWAKSLQS